MTHLIRRTPVLHAFAGSVSSAALAKSRLSVALAADRACRADQPHDPERAPNRPARENHAAEERRTS